MPSKGKIVVLRFSAMGDVAMVASVLQELVAQNSGVELVMVSRAAFKPFFDGTKNVKFHAIDPKTTHKGIGGLYKLFTELKKYNAVAVADLHDNLRSRILSLFFRLAGVKIKRIDKGRIEKRALTRSNNKVFKQLKQTVERYADVFRVLGFNLNLSNQLITSKKPLPTAAIPLFQNISKIRIGISPFAQHLYKVYPLEKMEIVIEKLNQLNYSLLIFGGGKEEKSIADVWSSKFANVSNIVGKFTLTEELAIISNLDLMLSMDSSGMHMASLMGVRVISIWGPTHPFAGFLGYGQTYEDCIQIDDINRPNSIYGNKPFSEIDETGMNAIEPHVVVQKIIEITNGKRTTHHPTR